MSAVVIFVWEEPNQATKDEKDNNRKTLFF
jgi:hypothetical protein